KVILLDAVSLVEKQLLLQLPGAIPRRLDLKDNLWRNPLFLPLEVGPAMPRRTANDHHGIGRHPDLGIALYRIPEQIAGNDRSRPAAKDGLQPLLEQDDPVELDGVLAN